MLILKLASSNKMFSEDVFFLVLDLIPKGEQNRRSGFTWLVGSIRWTSHRYILTHTCPTYLALNQTLPGDTVQALCRYVAFYVNFL